ncbi:hypothetical protein V8E36_005601 [Tilletia maclaganii]
MLPVAVGVQVTYRGPWQHCKSMLALESLDPFSLLRWGPRLPWVTPPAPAGGLRPGSRTCRLRSVRGTVLILQASGSGRCPISLRRPGIDFTTSLHLAGIILSWSVASSCPFPVHGLSQFLDLDIDLKLDLLDRSIITRNAVDLNIDLTRRHQAGHRRFPLPRRRHPSGPSPTPSFPRTSLVKPWSFTCLWVGRDGALHHEG